MSKNLTTRQRDELAGIRRFDQLVRYLRDELDWPIQSDSFEDLTFEYTPEELGIDRKNAAKIQEIKRLRPLSAGQPWGIFFVKFEPRKLPVVALRRILGSVALKKRASANSAERQAWAADDLLFVSNYGEGAERQISFAHFTPAANASDLPTLKVLGWDQQDTALHLDAVADTLHSSLAWPDDESDLTGWRDQWRAAFRLRHQEVITTSKDLSVRLAELARNIRDQIGKVLAVESDKGPFRQLLEGFRQSLVADLDEKGFADMYAQTISYGLLSARIVDPKHRTADDFAAHMRTSPFLRELMENFIRIGGRKKAGKGPQIDFDELGVSEVVELLDQANMEAVVRDFGREKRDEDPVIHFYENFLTEYDKQEKISRGVFYTPKPVVSYIVRSVDELLRNEFALEDGLADTTTWGEMAERNEGLEIPGGADADDPFVCILDPATGTGTFLVEAIEVIHATMLANWKAEGVRSEKGLLDRWNEYVPKHLLPRLHGYELMMAPYAIAHLKIGLKLLESGYRFESEERAQVYLTNALEPAQDFSGTFEFAIPALAHEAEAVTEIKRKKRFTVVIGNPPYLGEAGTGGEWIAGLMRGKDTATGRKTASYFEVDGQPLKERNSKWINDDYVKFTRLSHFLIDTAGYGIHGFISNHGYLDNPTFRGMRSALMASFHAIHALDLHGNLKKKETLPDGGKDVNVFDIEQGVGISLFIKRRAGTHALNEVTAYHADLRGKRQVKYDWLMANQLQDTAWVVVDAAAPFYLFEPLDSSEIGDYLRWPRLREIMLVNGTGIITKRDFLSIHFDAKDVWNTVTDFASMNEEEARRHFNLPNDVRDWKFDWAQSDVRDSGPSSACIRPILYRPFDVRRIYYTGRTRGFIGWPVVDVMGHMFAGENLAMMIGRAGQVIGSEEWNIVFAGKEMTEFNCFRRGGNVLYPLYLYPGVGKSDASLFHAWPAGEGGRRPNVNPGFVEAIEKATGLNFHSEGRGNLGTAFGPEDVLAYIYAVFHSPGYRRRFEPMLKLDFPRVPTLRECAPFAALASLGHELLALHLLESPALDKPIACYKGPTEPEIEKVSYVEETVWLDRAQTRGFKGVPEEVWSFHIGGYQVCEKWLKDRQAKGGKNPRPARILADEDIAHYQKIIVAISETIRIMGEIDEVIDHHGGWPYAFQAGESVGTGGES